MKSNSGKSASEIRVLVLGGAGFIGRHTVAALLPRRSRVVIGSRTPETLGARLPVARFCESRAVHLETLTEPRSWCGLLANVETVVNCVGILRPAGDATYERVHHLAPAALAQACAERNVRLVHVSALGLQRNARSRFLTSKRAGEIAVTASDADWHLVRPSLLDGEGGFGACWIRRVANWPLLPVAANAIGRIAPLDVRDLGEAIAVLATRTEPASQSCEPVYELGGSELRTMAEHLLAMRTITTRRYGSARIPALLARLVSHFCDLLRITPYSFGHYELLLHDNVPRMNRLVELLGRSPRLVRRRAAIAVTDAPNPTDARSQPVVEGLK